MFELSYSLSRSARLVRWGLLGISSAPVLGACAYNQGLRVPFLGCPVRHLTGIPCPTCGMTRSFMAIAQGDFHQAVVEHLFGPVVFVGFLIATAYLVLELGTGRRVAPLQGRWIGDRKLQLLTLLLVLSYHSLRLQSLSRSGELQVAFLHSPLGQLLFAS